MHNWNAPELIQKNLVIALERSGLKEKELASRLDISYMTVNNWICGRTTPSLNSLSKISEVLNIAVQDLFSENDLPLRKAPESENDVVTFQEINYVFLDKKRGFSTQYSRRTWPVPRYLLGGIPEREMRLLHLFDESFAPFFRMHDRLLLHCEGKPQEGDVLYMIKANGEPTIREMRTLEGGVHFLPFSPDEQDFVVSPTKVEYLSIFGRIVQMIRPVSPIVKPALPSQEETAEKKKD